MAKPPLVLQALLVDEMAVAPDKAEDMRDELLRAYRVLLPFGMGEARRSLEA
jgi:hypothetical protein